jgi:hypothetical protein
MPQFSSTLLFSHYPLSPLSLARVPYQVRLTAQASSFLLQQLGQVPSSFSSHPPWIGYPFSYSESSPFYNKAIFSSTLRGTTPLSPVTPTMCACQQTSGSLLRSPATWWRNTMEVRDVFPRTSLSMLSLRKHGQEQKRTGNSLERAGGSTGTTHTSKHAQKSI